MNAGDDYIIGLEGEQQKLFQRLHELLAFELDLECKIKFRIPFYYSKSWVCYLNPKKKTGVELVFMRGDEMSNEQGILEAKDRKRVRGVEYYKVQDINIDILLECIQEALILDESVPYVKKRTK